MPNSQANDRRSFFIYLDCSATNRFIIKKERRPTALRGGKKEKSIRDRGKTQGERAGDEEETDWEAAGKERREDA